MKRLFVLIAILFIISCGNQADINDVILTDTKGNYFFVESAGGKLYYITRLDSTKIKVLNE